MDEKLESFLKKLSEYQQPAKKEYDIEILKHISTKMLNTIFKGKKGICVYGDADADGVFSSMEIVVYLERLATIYRKDDIESGRFVIDLEYSNRAKDGFGLTETLFNELQEKYDLIITTDNGTSSPFLTKELENIIVMDHHPLNKDEFLEDGIKYVFNPNAYRTDNFYSTSGGMVVLDVIKFIERVLRDKEKRFQKYLSDPKNQKSHETMMEVLNEFAGFTIVSDMAVLDQHHREHLRRTLSGVAMKRDVIPLYTQFNGEYTQTSLSFNVIPKINIHRMEELRTVNKNFNRTYMEGYIRPKTKKEFTEALHFLTKVDTLKKSMIQEATSMGIKKVQNQNTSTVPLLILDNQKYKTGISGLIANKLLQKFNKPTIVGIVNKERKTISFSGRGENIKSVMVDILNGNCGGHQIASGGKIPYQENISTEDLTQALIKKINIFTKKHINLFKKSNIEIIHNPRTPLKIKEINQINKKLKEIAQGINYYKEIKVSMINFDVHALNVYKSGEWGVVSFTQGQNYIKDILFNAIEFTPESLGQAKGMILSLGTDGKYNIDSIYDDVEEMIQATLIMEEAVEFDIQSISGQTIEQREQKLHKISIQSLLGNKSIYMDNNKIYRYTKQLDIKNILIDDATLIVPAYTEEKLFKHTRMIDVFVGEKENVPFSEKIESQAISSFVEFTKKCKIASTETALIFPEDEIFSHPLLNDKLKVILKTLVEKNIYTPTKKIEKTINNDKGSLNEDDISTDIQPNNL